MSSRRLRWSALVIGALTACGGTIGDDAGLDAGWSGGVWDASVPASDAWSEAGCVVLDPPVEPSRPWTDGPADVVEVEPNDLAPFTSCDTCAGEPTRFVVGNTLAGTLRGDEEQDWFVTRLRGGSFVELALETRVVGPPVPLVVGTEAAATDEEPLGRESCCLRGPDRQYAEFRRSLEGTAGERAFFVPQDGDYFFSVQRARFSSSPVDYLIRTRLHEMPTVRGALGDLCDDLGAGSVGILRFATEEDLAVTVVDQHYGFGRVRWSYDRTDGTIGAARCGWDAESSETMVCFAASPLHEIWVVLDRRYAPSEGFYDLVVSTSHDDAQIPRSLRPGATLEGNIAAPGPASDPAFDTDYFRVTAYGDRALRLEAVAPPGSDLLPVIDVYEPPRVSGGVGPWFTALPDGATAAIEVPASDWSVALGDVRNARSDVPETPVGGPSFRYELRVSEVDWTAEPHALPFSATVSVGPGQTAWYEVPIETLVLVTATSDAGASARLVDELDATGGGDWASALATRVFDNAWMPRTTLRFGVRGDGFRASHIRFEALGFAVDDTVAAQEELEPNDTLLGATRVSSGARVRGRVEGVDESDHDLDLFRVSLRAGQTLMAYAERLPGESWADVHVLDAAGAPTAEVLDTTDVARVAFHAASADEDVYVAVSPACGVTACAPVTYVVSFIVP